MGCDYIPDFSLEHVVSLLLIMYICMVVVGFGMVFVGPYGLMYRNGFNIRNWHIVSLDYNFNPDDVIMEFNSSSVRL